MIKGFKSAELWDILEEKKYIEEGPITGIPTPRGHPYGDRYMVFTRQDEELTRYQAMYFMAVYSPGVHDFNDKYYFKEDDSGVVWCQQVRPTAILKADIRWDEVRNQ